MVQNPPPEQSKDKSFAKAITNINHVFVGNTIRSYMQKKYTCDSYSGGYSVVDKGSFGK